MNHSLPPEATVVRLQHLVELHDEAFVAAAYGAILRRAPDPGGLANYLAQVRAGADKAQIVVELAESPEGREKGVDLSRIRRAFPGYRKIGFSFWTRLFRRLTNASMEPTERQLRAIDNRLYLLEQSVAQQTKQVADLLAVVQQGKLHPASSFPASHSPETYEATHIAPRPQHSPSLECILAELKSAIAQKRSK